MPDEVVQYLKEHPHLTVISDSGASNPLVNGIAPTETARQPLVDVPKLKKRANKYHAEPIIYNGRRYPSKWQATKAQELDLLKAAGKIKGYLEEIPFRLPGVFTDKRGRRRQASHRVDFGIIELDNTVTWLERKGRDLPMGKLKRAQVESLFHIKIKME